MTNDPYYTLVSSLPRLPHFSEAQWLPLSRKQLDQRLTMLNEEDALQMRLAEDMVKWQRQPISRTSEQVAENFRRAMPQITHPSLREFVEFRMAQRTAMVALRRRRLGLPRPAKGETWGVGSWLLLISDNWDKADLGLGHLLPWLEDAEKFLDTGAALELEWLLMEAVWVRLGRIADRNPFGLEPIMSFVFRLDILQRWLTYNDERGRARFQQLVTEVTREQQQLFA